MARCVRNCLVGLLVSIALGDTEVTADDEIVISPPFRLETATDANWWALEFVGAARRVFDDVAAEWSTEVIGMWMRDRSDGLDPELAIRTVCMGFTNDAGTTWTFMDMQAPGQSPHEFDPMACFDPISGSLYAGTMAGGHKDWISRLAPGDHELEDFSALQLVKDDEGAHRPSAGAGPKPEAPTEHRVYVSANYDLTWSDNLGVTWSPILAQVGDGIHAWAVPRVGSSGQLYLAHRFNAGGSIEVRLDRSIALNNDAAETPIFLPDSKVADTDGGLDPNWVPSILRMTDVVACAVAPHDGNRVYVAWLDKTSEEENECDTTNHNVDLYFSMTEDATVATPTWTTKKIVPADVEVPGDQFYPWLEATTFMDGEEEKTRLHLVWYDSRHNPDQCDTGMGNDQTFLFDVYYAYSDDEGETWNEFRLTEESMNTAYSIEALGPGAPEFFGDYIGMAVVGKRVFPFASIATSVLVGEGAPFGYSEAYTWMIVFGDRPSYEDLTIVEGSVGGIEDLALVTSSNDQRLVVSDSTGSAQVPLTTIVDIELDTAYTGVDGDDEIDIRVECHADEPDVTGRIYLKGQPSTAQDWVLWREFEVNEDSDENTWKRMIPAIKQPPLSPSTWDFVGSDGRMDVRIEMTRPWSTGLTLTSRIDYVEVVVVDND